MSNPEGRPLRVHFFHIMKSNFSGAQKNIFRLVRRIDRAKIEPVLFGQMECELTRLSREAGIEVTIVPFPKGLEVFSRGLLMLSMSRALGAAQGMLSYNASLVRLFRQDKPDVVWCDNVRTFFTIFVACKMVGATVIWNVWSEPKGRVAWLLHRAAVMLADRVNLEYANQGTKVFGRLGNGLFRKKIVPLYTGVTDFDESIGTDIRAELGLPDACTVLLMGSNITPEKGQMDLLEAMERLVDEFPDLHLLIAGAPVHGHAESVNYYDEVRKRAARGAIAERVRLLGWRSDIRDILEASDIYASTSYAESFPDTVREAMQAGKAVVVTNVGGTEELVDVGRSGYLFEPGDVCSLVDHIRTLADSPELRESMGAEGERIIAKRFSTAAYVRNFEDMVIDAR